MIARRSVVGLKLTANDFFVGRDCLLGNIGPATTETQSLWSKLDIGH